MKNIATVLVGSALILGLSFAFVTPAKADLLSDLQAQVQALLAQISALQGGSTTTSGAGCHAFTMTHQQGDSGGEVMWIQQFLNSHGAQVAASGAGSPGNETAYYGALTKAAVAKWQAANGVMPAAGYWGPITRAKVASVCAGSTPTNPTNPTSPAGLNGAAGSITVSQTSVDVEDEVFTSQTEKVLGFDVEASGGDVRVTNVRVKFTHQGTAASSDRLQDYAKEISIWADDQKIASMSPSDFVRDSSGVYSASIPVSQVVRMGSASEVTFHVGFTANDTIDSDDAGSTNDWTVELIQTRYVDATGVTLFDSTTGIKNEGSGAIGAYVTRISSSSDVTLRMGEGSGHPKAKNVKVNESGSTEVVLAEFTLKAEGADMRFDSLVASTTVTGVSNTGTMVQEFYLKRGSSRIADAAAATSGTGQVVTFNLDDTETISKDTTQTYSVVAKVNSIGSGSGSSSNFDNGDTITASTSPSIGDINAKAVADGKSITDRAGSITTYTQTLYSEGIQISKVGESFSLTPNDTLANTVGEYKVTLRVTNFGSNDVYVPLNTLATTSSSAGSTKGVAYGIQTSSSATSTGVSATLVRVSGGTELTNSVRISGGASADFQVTVTFNPDASFSGSQQYRVQVWSVGTATSDTATAATITNTVPVEDFRTSYSTINN